MQTITDELVLAQRKGMRIHEVAVDWVDDPDSRVDLISTALNDLPRRGPARSRLIDRPVPRIGIASTATVAAQPR